MARIALIYFLIIVAAIGAGLATSRGPWIVLRKESEATARNVREMRESEREREELTRKAAKLRGSLGTEELARSRGQLPEGEVLAPVATTVSTAPIR